MRIALLTIDVREDHRRYSEHMPFFPAAPEALLEGFIALPEIQVHVVSCTQQPLRGPDKLADNIWFHSLYVPKTGWMRTLYQGCIRATRKKLRELQPDIVHGQGTEREGALGAAFSGFPNVVTIHGNMKAMANFYHARVGNFFWLAARLETIALRRTGGVFCNSAYTESMVAPRAKRTWRVPNALRTQFFSPLPVRPANFRPILLNIGVLTPHKRQTDILRVAGNLWKRGLRFEIQFVGDVHRGVPYDEDFLTQLLDAETAGYARHLGAISSGEVLAAMDAADALLHFPTEESFGLVVAEALARNLKLFAASVGGIMDIAAGMDGAELFPMNDFAALEKSLAQWMETGSPRPSHTSATMRQRYLPETIARRHLDIYREVLKTRS